MWQKWYSVWHTLFSLPSIYKQQWNCYCAFILAYSNMYMNRCDVYYNLAVTLHVCTWVVVVLLLVVCCAVLKEDTETAFLQVEDEHPILTHDVQDISHIYYYRVS